MTRQPTATLPLIPSTSSGCSCCAPRSSDTHPTATLKEATALSTTTKSYAVTGMTCSHCVTAVSAELGALAGVTDVHVDLIAGGISTVTVSSDTPLTAEQVAAALDEAGDYRLSTDQPR